MNVDPFSLPLARPLATAGGTIDTREGFLVTVEAAGERGLGEATPLPGWTESLDDCRNALERVDDPVDALAAPAAPAGDTGALADCPAARHGVALALADARARAAGDPLYRHLGGPERVEHVPVNATVGDAPPEETAREVQRAAAAGFPAVKVKVGARDVGADVERLRTVRERLRTTRERESGGSGRSEASAQQRARVELRADANGAWTREQAREAFDALADLGVAYVEQPLSADDLDGHRALRDDTDGTASRDGVEVALDESVAVHGVDAVLGAAAADRLVCKPMVLGGPDRAREAALRAREAGLGAVVTTTVDGAVARAGAVHVAASLPDVPACGLATGARLAADLLDDPAPVVEGAARVPQKPGNAGHR